MREAEALDAMAHGAAAADTKADMLLLGEMAVGNSYSPDSSCSGLSQRSRH